MRILGNRELRICFPIWPRVLQETHCICMRIKDSMHCLRCRFYSHSIVNWATEDKKARITNSFCCQHRWQITKGMRCDHSANASLQEAKKKKMGQALLGWIHVAVSNFVPERAGLSIRSRLGEASPFRKMLQFPCWAHNGEWRGVTAKEGLAGQAYIVQTGCRTR